MQQNQIILSVLAKTRNLVEVWQANSYEEGINYADITGFYPR